MNSTTSSRRSASPDYLSTLSRILGGQLPYQEQDEEGDGQAVNAFAPMPPMPKPVTSVPGARDRYVSNPATAPVAFPTAGAPGPAPVQGPPLPVQGPPSPPPIAPVSPLQISQVQGPQQPDPVQAHIDKLLNTPYDYAPIPAPHKRDTRGEGQRGLIASLAGALLGGALGGTRGALTGFAGAGQGAQAGADEVAQQQAQMDAMAQQRAMNHNQMTRYQQMNDVSELGRLSQLQRSSEMARKDTLTGQNQLVMSLMNMAPEDQQAYLKSPLGQARLQELGIPATVDESGNVSIPSLGKASQEAINEKNKAASSAKNTESFTRAFGELAKRSKPARAALAPILQQLYPEIADKVPDLVERLNNAENQSDVLKAQDQKQTVEQKRLGRLSTELSGILKGGNDAGRARANQILQAISPGAAPYGNLTKPLTPQEQETARHNRVMEGIDAGKAAAGGKDNSLGWTRLQYDMDRNQQQDAAKAATQAITKYATQRDSLLSERDRLNSALRTGTYQPKSGAAIDINDADRAGIRQRVQSMESEARGLDDFILKHGGPGAPRPYLPDGPATAFSPSGGQAPPKAAQQPSPVPVPGKGYQSVPPPAPAHHSATQPRDGGGKWSGPPAKPLKQMTNDELLKMMAGGR